METIKIETGPGDMFERVAERAKRLATDKNTPAEFDFNGVTSIVSKDTDLALIYRDYQNSFTMDWKIIGPLCQPEYDTAIDSELSARKVHKEAVNALKNQLSTLESNESKRRVERQINDVLFDVVDADGYKQWKAKNTDGYGNACFEFAEMWARLMQDGIAKGAEISSIADKTSHKLDFIGITGFQYGCAIQILKTHWKHGEELYRWHKKDSL